MRRRYFDRLSKMGRAQGKTERRAKLSTGQQRLFEELFWQTDNNRRRNIYPHNESELPVQNWYSLVAGFSSSFVSQAIEEHGLTSSQFLLDPFAGMGTSLLAAQLKGVTGIGIEVNPFGHFVARVKLAWSVRRDVLWEQFKKLKDLLAPLWTAEQGFQWQEVPTTDLKVHLSTIKARRTRNGDSLPATGSRPPGMPHLYEWISPTVVDKVLRLKDEIWKCELGGTLTEVDDFIRLAFASVLLPVSNMQLAGPKICFRRKRGKRVLCLDAPVVKLFLEKLHKMICDLEALPECESPAQVVLGDARKVDELIEQPVDAAVTSPPYLNEVDYLDNTRLELYFLGFLETEQDLRALKERMIRANAKYLFSSNRDYPDNLPDGSVFQEIRDLCHQIEERWKQRDWGWDHPRLVAEYFLDMGNHLQSMVRVLKTGAPYLMIVGDSAIDGILIPTDEILAKIALQVGFSSAQVKPFRQRGSSRHPLRLRESVITLWK